MGILLRRVNKTYRFLVTSGCLLSRKVWWAVRISSFWQKIEVFYRPEWTKVMNLKMNFKYFQIQKWMLRTGWAEKVDTKNGVICIIFMFPSLVMILKLSKKCIFSILCWPQQKNLSKLKQFTHKYLKGLVKRFQKMVFYYAMT